MKTITFSQRKKQWRTEVSNLLTKAGFTVIKHSICVDDSCEPGIGHLVTLRGKQTPELRKKAEAVLWNFAYNIQFQS